MEMALYFHKKTDSTKEIEIRWSDDLKSQVYYTHDI